MLFTGTSSDDNFEGTANIDTFNMAQGGSDKVSGAGGNDIFNFGGALNADDEIDGGSGDDTLNLNGDYSAGLIFNATTIASVEHLHLGAGHDYSLQFVVVPAGQTLTLDATALGAGDSVSFGGGSGTGTYILNGGAGDDVLVSGAGNDVITGGAGSDTINPNTGNDTVHAGAGQDFITFVSNGTFNVDDTLDGGDDYDFLSIFGNSSAQSYVFKPTTIQNIENLTVGSTSFNITLDDANIAANAGLTVSGASLSASETLVVDGSHETDGHLTLIGGAGNDRLTGGKQFDVFLGQGGKDVLTGRGGADSFQYHQVSESTGKNYDTIVGFNPAQDAFFFDVAVTKVEHPVQGGSLSTATFNADLHAALGTHPSAGHAVLFEPDAGTLAGNVFLIVDANGLAGYQAGGDFVIKLASPVSLDLTTFDFRTP